MEFRSLLQTLRDEFPYARCDDAPNHVPQLVPAGAGRPGLAAHMQLEVGRNQQTCWLPREFRDFNPSMLFVAAPFRFPKGADRTTSDGVAAYGHEHKMIIVDSANSNQEPGRILIGTRGGGTTPPISIYFERCDPYGEWHNSYGSNLGIDVDSKLLWPDDGAWHWLSAMIERTGGGADRVQVWFDTQLAMDFRGRTCTAHAPPVPRVCFGAFYNMGARFPEFFVGPPIVAETRVALDSPIVIPPIDPKPPVVDVAGALAQLDAAYALTGEQLSALSTVQQKLTQLRSSIDVARTALRPK